LQTKQRGECEPRTVFWKPIGKYGHLMSNEKEKEKGEKKYNHRKTKTLRTKRQ